MTALIPGDWDGEEEITGLPPEVLDSAVSDGVSGASDAVSSIDTDGDGNESIAEIMQKTAAAITTVQRLYFQWCKPGRYRRYYQRHRR